MYMFSNNLIVIRYWWLIILFYYILYVIWIWLDFTCIDKQHKCADGLQCIAEHRLCDGYEHCTDRSDEDPDFCRGIILRDFNTVTYLMEFYFYVTINFTRCVLFRVVHHSRGRLFFIITVIASKPTKIQLHVI